MEKKRKSQRGGTIPPSAEILAEVACILNEGAKRATHANRACSGISNCCRFRLTGETPYVTYGEAWVAWLEWKATGRVKLDLHADGSCPLLSAQGLCMIYKARPMACRTHFCIQAGGALPRREVVDLIGRLEDIDVKIGGCGPVKLPDALKRLAKK
ncbi:MAG: YkgJ family cysteine cluster protein [Akkermansia sp.]